MEWTNWSGWVRAQPQNISDPKAKAKSSSAVRDGTAPVRVVGVGHSFTPLGQTDGTLISLDEFQGVVAANAKALDRDGAGGQQDPRAGAAAVRRRASGLKNQGDIDRQAIAGAVGTGTHGTGPTLGSLSAEVKSFRLVAADGQVLDCSPSSNADVWQAGRVSFGSLGVMSEITLKRAQGLQTARTQLGDAGGRVLARSGEAARRAPAFRVLLVSPCRRRHRQVARRDRRRCRGALERGRDGRARRARDAPISGRSDMAASLRASCRRLSARMQRLLTKASMGASSRARWSHEIFPSPRNIRFNEMEYAVPAANGADCIREIAEVIRARKIAGVYPLEFRFVKADDIWLSPFYKRDAVTISVHQYHRQSYDELFAAAEAIFRRYGGRPHWGKLHTLQGRRFREALSALRRLSRLARAARPRRANSSTLILAGIFGEAHG